MCVVLTFRAYRLIAVLSKQSVPRGKLQLLGATSMMLAAKYEEVRKTQKKAKDYAWICNGQYSTAEVCYF